MRAERSPMSACGSARASHGARIRRANFQPFPEHAAATAATTTTYVAADICAESADKTSLRPMPPPRPCSKAHRAGPGRRFLPLFMAGPRDEGCGCRLWRLLLFAAPLTAVTGPDDDSDAS